MADKLSGGKHQKGWTLDEKEQSIGFIVDYCHGFRLGGMQ
jgi:hypothetical protein